MSDFSEEQEAALLHERFVAAVIKTRAESKPEESFWRFLLGSAGGAALITVLVGGLFTTVIAAIFQHASQARSFQNDMIKLYGADRLQVSRATLTRQLDLVAAALQLIGKAEARTSSKIDVESSSFSKKQREEVRKKFNAMWEDWDASKVSLRSSLAYYLGPAMSSQWSQLSDCMDLYIRCAVNTRPDNYGTKDCKPMRAGLDHTLNTFVVALSSTRPRPGVEDWITAEEVKRVRKLVQER